MPPPIFARIVPYLYDRYRFKRHMYHTLLRSVTFVGDHTLRATEHLHQCYAHKIRTQTIYNETMGQLEETAAICAGVRDGLVLRGPLQLSGGVFVRARLQLADVIERLRWLGRRQGACTLHDLLQLEFGVDVVRTLNGWWAAFVQTTFVPLAYNVYRLPSDANNTVTQCELARNPFEAAKGGSVSSKSGTSKGKGKSRSRRGKKRTMSRSSASSSNAHSQTTTASVVGGATGATPHHAVDVTRIMGLVGAVASVATITNERTHPCEQLCYLLHDGVTTENALVPTGGTSGSQGNASQTLLGFASPSKPGQTGVPQSLVETIHGARVYVPLWDQGYIVALSGTFRTDSFQTTMNHVPLFTKHRQLRQLVVQCSVIPEAFSAGWVQQLSLRDLLVYNARELSDQCIRDFQRLQQYKAKTISTLVKEFLSSPLALQRDILTLFLLTEQDSDTQYLAYLMYDMISQESYLLKPQPLAEEIYNHLHWCIKKRFKVVIENIQEFTKRLSTFTENDINYESRIFLMKAPDAVKKKAMEKLKEVQSKNGNETNHKAQQYLDGLLRVPFGIYRRERMFSFLQDFSHRIRTHCEQFCHATDADAQATDPLAIEHRALTDPQRRLTYERINTFLRTTVSLAEGDAAAATTVYASAPCDWATIEAVLAARTHGALSKRVTACKKALGVKALVYPSGEGAGQTKVQARVKGLAVAVPALAAALTQYAQKVERGGDVERWAACVAALEISDAVDTATPPSASASATASSVVYAQFRDQLRALSTEWTQYKQDTQTYLKGVDDILEKSVFGHAKAKRSIKQVIAQWITGDLKGYCFGFEGPPGTGKTSLAKNGLSKCLVDVNGERRPFSFIALGGSSNGSTLEGHSYTYVGSIWGRIVDILMETECMNPIIYIDELDKVSRTEHGRELIGILTHITDSTQNEEFMDKYFAGIKIDLSRVLFVFSYNDPDLIDPILRDRIHVVRFSPLKQADKHEVCGRHLIPEILKTVGLGRSDLVFPQEVIDFIIDHYTAEGGVRRLKEKLFEICRDLNIRHLSDPKTYAFPYTVTPAFLKDDLFVEHPIVHRKRILASPRVGLTNGMYATTLGVGGITIIECFVVPKSSFMAMELTGQQGDVMKESMSVAKTVAWNLLTEETKGALCEASKANSIGLHVHCPDGGTPKDGPSAGTAITISILSSLLKCPVNNKVAITGEIDLNGQVCQIGGLDTKVRGAKKAGVQTVLFPASNAHDLQTIKKHYDPFDAGFKFAMVETIWDVLPYVFPGLGYEFVRF